MKSVCLTGASTNTNMQIELESNEMKVRKGTPNMTLFAQLS